METMNHLKLIPSTLLFTLICSSLTMAQMDTLELGTEHIAGNRQRLQGIPGSAHTLNQADLGRQNYTDIHRVLREIPGVDVMEEEGYGNRPSIGIRGTSIERNGKIVVMEDGILAAPAPYAAPAAYYFPTVGRIHAVEVRKGSSQVPYGPGTTGGALNLVSTRIPQKTSGQVTLTTGQDGLQRAHAWAGGNHGILGWLLETHQHSVDGFKRLPEPADYHSNLQNNNTGFARTDNLLKIRLRAPANMGPHQELEAKFGVHSELANETYLGLTRDDFDANPYHRYAASAKDRLTVEQQQVSLRYRIQPTQNLNLTMRIYRTGVHRNWYKLDRVQSTGLSTILDNEAANLRSMQIIRGANSDSANIELKANNRKYQTMGAQISSEWTVQTGPVRHLLEKGLRLHTDSEDRFQWVDFYEMIDSTLSLQRAGTPGTAENRIGSASALAFHVQDAMSFGNVSVTPGLRLEHISYLHEDWGSSDPQRANSPTKREASTTVVVWGLGSSYFVSPELTIFGGVHRGFQPPGPAANDSSEAERSINMELGTRAQKSSLRTEATVFMNSYQNLLGKESAAGGGASTGELFNGGEALVFGVELSAGVNIMEKLIPASRLALPLRGNYTFTQGEFRSDFESSYRSWGSVRKGHELPYLPRHRFMVGGGAEYGDWSLDLVATYVGVMRARAGSESIDYRQNPGDYTTIDAQVAWQLHESLQVFGGGKNLTNTEGVASRIPAGFRPIMPRTLQVGARASF